MIFGVAWLSRRITAMAAMYGHAPRYTRKEATMTHPNRLMYPPPTGLIIDEPWISGILNDEKTGEMRAHAEQQRGRMAQIKEGSGQVVGAAILVAGVAPLTRQPTLDAISGHRIPSELISSGRVNSRDHPRVLANVLCIHNSVRYHYRFGAVIYVPSAGAGSAGLDTVEHYPDGQPPHAQPAVAASRRAARLDAEPSGLMHEAEDLLQSRFKRIRKPSLCIARFRKSRARKIAIERKRQQLSIRAAVARSGLRSHADRARHRPPPTLRSFPVTDSQSRVAGVEATDGASSGLSGTLGDRGGWSYRQLARAGAKVQGAAGVDHHITAQFRSTLAAD
jgi:hypothetical protein